MTKLFRITALFFLACATAAALEPAAGDRVQATFSDPSRPGLLKVHVLSGSITVKGYSGKEVIIEASGRERDQEPATKDGMKRITANQSGLAVEEENNVMDVGLSYRSGRATDLVIQVPQKTNLSLHSVNGRAIEVADVEGEVEVNCTNGSVTLTHVSGAVVAHALNGKITVTMTRVDSTKPMAFSSMNGDINVTLPADLKATLSMSTEHGEIYSDFDVALGAANAPVVEDSRKNGGKFHLRVDRMIHGTINGGGQNIQFKNYNGGIYIHKAS